MKHIKKYSLFEAKNPADLYSVSYNGIPFKLMESTPEFQEILGLGFENLTTPLIYKRGGIKFAHPIVNAFKNNNPWSTHSEGVDWIQIYNYGTIRTSSSGNPAILKKGDRELTTLVDYREKMREVIKYMKKIIAKRQFGISGTKELDRMSDLSYPEYVIELHKLDPVKTKSIIIDRSNNYFHEGGIEKMAEFINKMMEETPEETIIILKDFWKDPVFKDLQNKINVPERYKGELGLMSDLKDLGF